MACEINVEHREYSSFGELDAIYEELGGAKSWLLSNIAYTGQQYDPHTGLLHYDARWHDLSAGRFHSEDPIEEGSNWYLYVLNDPIAITFYRVSLCRLRTARRATLVPQRAPAGGQPLLGERACLYQLTLV